MKFAAIIAVIISASALAACNTTGPYASAAGPSASWTSYPSGYQSINAPWGHKCGDDIAVCHYERRDARDRGQQ